MLADCAQNRVRHFGTTTETPSVVITLPHKSLLFNFLDSNSCYRYECTSRHPINFQYHPHIIQHHNGKELSLFWSPSAWAKHSRKSWISLSSLASHRYIIMNLSIESGASGNPSFRGEPAVDVAIHITQFARTLHVLTALPYDSPAGPYLHCDCPRPQVSRFLTNVINNLQRLVTSHRRCPEHIRYTSPWASADSYIQPNTIPFALIELERRFGHVQLVRSHTFHAVVSFC